MLHNLFTVSFLYLGHVSLKKKLRLTAHFMSESCNPICVILESCSHVVWMKPSCHPLPLHPHPSAHHSHSTRQGADGWKQIPALLPLLPFWALQSIPINICKVFLSVFKAQTVSACAAACFHPAMIPGMEELPASEGWGCVICSAISVAFVLSSGMSCRLAAPAWRAFADVDVLFRSWGAE